MTYKYTLSLCFAIFTAAMTFAAQRKVEQVIIRADDNYNIDPTQAVLDTCSIDTLVNDQLHDEQEIQRVISADIEALLSTPAYADARADIGANETTGDWVVIYTISRRPQLAEDPAIIGLDGEVSESRVLDVLNDEDNEKIRKIGRLQHVDEAIANEGLRRIANLLSKKGYVEVDIQYELRYSDVPGYAYLTYIITPGKERVIDAYLFEGNTVYDHDTLAETFGWMPAYNPFSWFADFPISDEQLETARSLVSNYYYNAGYLDVSVAAPRLQLIEETDDEKIYTVVYAVEEGERYTIGNISVSGSTIVPQHVLEASGRHALTADNTYATEANLTAVRKAIVKNYTNAGYVDTYAVPTMVPAESGYTMDIAYAITEGERIRISAIDIKGNRTTQDKVIRRELVITPGEYYNEDLVEQSEARLSNLNYFENGSVTSYTIKDPTTPGERRLVFEVQEARTLSTSLTLGISTVDSVFVAGSIIERNFDLFNPGNNFRGGGQRASATVEFGSRRQTFNVGWSQPWLFDMPLAFTVNAYRNMRWRDNYDEIRMGMKFDLAWKPEPIWTPFGDYQMDRIGVRYTIEDVSYDDEEAGTWYCKNGKPFSFTNQEEGINSKFRLYWTENHLDRVFIPTSGWKSEVYAEVGVGGDAKDYGFGFNVTKYWKPFNNDHVLMGRFRFNTIEAYSGDVPMFDRFFIGGPNTVRGFEFRDGGPKASHGGDHVAIGGQTLWCATAEYTIPLASFLRFAVFSDIGSVGEDFCDLGDDLLWSAGCGFRLDFEQFPIRIDVAKPLVNDDDTEEEVFLFSIGNF
ncbi:MAG: outer membrane protein assembly factor BamA [bacterium]|nr:outer membrane protein assembly factor BamA [bacterium]